MLDLRVGEGLVDSVDRPAWHPRLVQPLDPIGVRVLADEIVQMGIERRAVFRTGDDSRKIWIVREILGTRHFTKPSPQIVAGSSNIDVAVGGLEHAGAWGGRVEITLLPGDLALHQIPCCLEIEHEDLRLE